VKLLPYAPNMCCFFCVVKMSRSLLKVLVLRGSRAAASAWPQGAGDAELSHRCDMMDACVALTTSTDLEPMIAKQFATFTKALPQLCVGVGGLSAAVRLVQYRSLMAPDREQLLTQLSRSWTSADKAASWTPNDCVEMLHHVALGEMYRSDRHLLVDSLVVHIQMHHRELSFDAAAKVLWSLSTPANARSYVESPVFRLCAHRIIAALQAATDVSEEGIVLLAEAVARVPLNVIPPTLSEALGTAVGQRPYLDVAPPSGGHRELLNAWWVALQPNELSLASIRCSLKLMACDSRGSHSVARIKILQQRAAAIVQSRAMLPADLSDIAGALDGMVRFVAPLVQDAGSISLLASTMSALLKGDHQPESFSVGCSVAIGFASAESSHAGASDGVPWQLVERFLRRAVVPLDSFSNRDYVALTELLCLGRDASCMQVVDELLTSRWMCPTSITELLRCVVVASCRVGVDVVVSRVAKLLERLWDQREMVVATHALIEPLQHLRPQDTESTPLFLFVLKQWEQHVSSSEHSVGLLGLLRTAESPSERAAAAVQIATTAAAWKDTGRQQQALRHLLTQAHTVPWLEPFLLHVPMHRDGVVPVLANLPMADLLLLTEASHGLSEQAQPHLRHAMVHNVLASVAQGVRQLEQPINDGTQHQCIVLLLLLEHLHRDSSMPQGAKDLANAVLDVLHSSPTGLTSRQESLLAVLEVLLVGEISPRQGAYFLG
jgi:hypothetical protein